MSDTPNDTPPIDDLLRVMAALRTPVTGCPWDLEQTFATIAPYTIEEAYEVADAIARGDLGDLRDELGDLLLQVVYHARIAEEQGAFAFDDVVRAVTGKMIRRHPHVFGSPEERAAGAAPGFWQRIKDAERRAKDGPSSARPEGLDPGPDPRGLTPRVLPASLESGSDPAGLTPQTSLLDDVPLALPALTRAVKLQDKAAKVGFDWPSLAPVFEKLREEMAEFEEVALPADPRGAHLPPASHDAIVEEYGDILFVMANIARHLEIDPEAALRAANQKFTRRFRHIEARLAEQDRTPAQSDLAEMDALWDEARAADKARR